MEAVNKEKMKELEIWLKLAGSEQERLLQRAESGS